MAIITGLTAEKMNELNGASVVSGAVNTAGSLILTTRGGDQIDAGNVKGPKGDTGSITTAQLAPYVARWKAGTAYTVGTQVIAPTNMLMTANVAHTAGTSFTTDFPKWNGVTLDVPYGHMGRTLGSLPLGTTTPIIMGAAQELKGGMTYDDESNSLVIPKSGRYQVNLKGYFSGPISNINQVGILINGADVKGPNQKLTAAGGKPSNSDIALKSSGTVYFEKGNKISIFQSSSAAAFGSTGYDGTCIEIMYIAG